LEHILEVGVEFDIIELCGGDEGADHGPALAATI
jgi:hypothetical protein